MWEFGQLFDNCEFSSPTQLRIQTIGRFSTISRLFKLLFIEVLFGHNLLQIISWISNYPLFIEQTICFVGNFYRCYLNLNSAFLFLIKKFTPQNIAETP